MKSYSRRLEINIAPRLLTKYDIYIGHTTVAGA